MRYFLLKFCILCYFSFSNEYVLIEGNRLFDLTTKKILNYTFEKKISSKKNFYVVKKGGVFSLFKEGNILGSYVNCQLIYEYLGGSEKKYVFAVKKEKWGLVNGDNQLIINFNYDTIKLLNREKGFLLLKLNNKYGVVNYLGEVILDQEYDSIHLINDDYFLCKKKILGI